MLQLIVVLLMLSGWLTANHFPPWVSWHSELPFFVIALGLATWSVVRNGTRTVTALPIAGLLPLALGLVLAIQAAMGLMDWMGQILVVALYLLIVLTAISWGWREGSAAQGSSNGMPGEWLACALVAGAVLSAGIALAQVMRVADGLSFIAPTTYARRPGGNLAQPNHLSTLLVMGLAGACYLHSIRRMSLAALALLSGYFALGIAVTESRGGLLSALALAAFLAWKRPLVSRRASIQGALVAGLSSLGFFLAWPSFYRFVFRGLDEGEAALERLASSGGDPRLALWQQMLEASLQRPWIGWGIRDSAEAHNSVSHEVVGALPITYSHNIVIDMLVWIGWPLTLMMVVATGVWGWSRVRGVGDSASGWFGMAMLIPFAIHSLLEFPFAYAYFLLPVMYGVGLIEASARGGVRVFRLPGWLAAPSVLVLALCGAWSVIDYLHVEEDFRIARFQLMRIGSPQEMPAPQIHVLNQLEQMVASTRVPLTSSMSHDRLELLRRTAVHNPWTGSQYRYASALAFNGKYEEARRQMLVLRAQHGIKVFKLLNVQLEQDLAKRGLPALDVGVAEP